MFSYRSLNTYKEGGNGDYKEGMIGVCGEFCITRDLNEQELIYVYAR